MKKVISLLLLVFSVPILIGCSKQSDTYFPTKEGVPWVYQKYTTGMMGTQESAKHVRSYLKERELNGKKVYPLKIEEGGKTWFIFISEDKEGRFVYANQPVNASEPIILNPPRYYVKFPIKVGTEWKYESKTYLLEKVVPITMQYNVVGIDETVTVPLGTYNKCIKIKGTGQTTIDLGFMGKAQVNKEVNNWYAPNVGFIKSVEKEESNNILVGSKTVTLQLEEFKNK